VTVDFLAWATCVKEKSAASSGKKKGHGANPKKHAEAPHLTKI
jgi:hypothetical protein